jgi:hypothetical protein
MRALLFNFLAISFFITGCSGDESCAQAISLQSYEQNGYTLILDYVVSATTVEASITSGSANPDDGIILPVTNNALDFSQAGILPGNYGLYLRTVCNGNTSDWSFPIPIVIDNVCDVTIPAISYIQRGVKLYPTANNTAGSPAEIRFRPDNGEDKIVRIDYLNSIGINLHEKGIAPGHYICSLRIICGAGVRTVWSENIEINITDYHCLTPVDFGIYNNNNQVDITWARNSDYDKWEYVHLNEGDPISTGQIISTTQNSIIGLSASVGKDLFVRGVCGENTYTDWAQAF